MVFWDNWGRDLRYVIVGSDKRRESDDGGMEKEVRELWNGGNVL